jgi:hypothetical protein
LAIIVSTSATIFATTISYFKELNEHEPSHIFENAILFNLAFSILLLTDTGSVSQASTIAFNFIAAIPSIPLPQPTSIRVSPSFTYLEIALNDEAVVG